MNYYNQIKDLLTFTDPDDFYFLQILQRKKDNPEIGSNSRVIKNYFIRSHEYLEMRMDEIETLCDTFNARAMLRLNKRNRRKVALHTIKIMADKLMNEDYSFDKAYVRACGKVHHDPNKKWIIDIDDVKPDDNVYLNLIINIINNKMPEGDKILKILPTKNGVHLITRPFNTMDIHKALVNIDIHRDNPINLYIPD